MGFRTRREAMAIHEATHAEVALKLNLPVEWASIDFGEKEGFHFFAAVSLDDDQLDMERDRFAICVAMASPSFLDTYDEEVDRYAKLEADLAYQIAGMHGIDPGNVYDEAATLVSDLQVEIHDTADRLEAEGRVVFATA